MGYWGPAMAHIWSQLRNSVIILGGGDVKKRPKYAHDIFEVLLSVPRFCLMCTGKKNRKHGFLVGSLHWEAVNKKDIFPSAYLFTNKSSKYFLDAPYIVRGVSTYQDVYLWVCPRHFREVRWETKSINLLRTTSATIILAACILEGADNS